MTCPPGQRFDAVADAHNQSRPGYPTSLVDRLGPPGDTLEIGCGSGQLTVDLLRRSHRVLGVDDEHVERSALQRGSRWAEPMTQYTHSVSPPSERMGAPPSSPRRPPSDRRTGESAEGN